MDYEKKYKDAVSAIKFLLYKSNRENLTADKYREELESIIPELKESDDERIGKEIVNFINHKKAMGSITPEESKRTGSWIAWLEKQGEQKPAEWSEEDKNTLDFLVGYLLDTIKKMPAEEYAGGLGKAVVLLKSIKDKVQPQPKREWCGDDEAHLHSLITHLEQWIERNPDTTGADIQGENIAWLKSLRLKSQWKPSVEQLDALESATVNCAYSEYQDCLRELIGQLKKLKE